MTVKWKRLLSAILSFVMIFSLINVFPAEKYVYANETNPTETKNRFHYDQLTEEGKAVYDGIYQMYTSGLLKSGTAVYDLVNILSPEQMEAFGNNTASLKTAMNAARYAFYADYPEVFYVNFSKLTYRTTRDSQGKFHINLGSGRNPSYLIDGLPNQQEVEAAISEFDARVNEIVSGAQSLEIKEGKNAQAEQARYVHKEIIENASYRLEDSAFVGEFTSGKILNNAPFLGTPYGVLVRKQGVCEGYARAFKVVMDKLGINCILVQGAHQNDTVAVNHMWNYVELTNTVARTRAKARSVESKWYAVDATLDDPEFPVETLAEIEAENQMYKNNHDMAGDGYGKTGYEYEKYLLAGQLTMNGKHYVAEEVDAAGGYCFAYPPIEDNDFDVKSVTNDMDGFVVKSKDVYDKELNKTVTEFQFNYLGMTATEAREKGIYLLFRYYEYNDEGELVPIYNQYHGGKSWCYVNTEVYAISEEEGFVHIREHQVPYVEVAATMTPPAGEFPYNLMYGGDDSGLIARTGKLYNPNQHDYKAPPFIKTQTPTQTSVINIGNRFYHIKAEYDEKLKLDEGYTMNTISGKIVCKSGLGNPVTGSEYSQIKNFQWDGDRTIEFDMKFSLMFADDNVNYSIYPVGLIGETSEKAPNPVTYGVAQKTACPSVMHRDGNWEIFGKPTLMESDDLSMKDWKTSTGRPVSDLLLDRLTLVASKPSEKQTETMEDMVEGELPGETKMLDSATYNIALSVCKACVIETGHKVKVKLGFPGGYGPNDEGVTFKAYHFKRDNQGNIIGVEEIDCVVTQYGLILTCDAFSPFMVAAVEKDETVVEPKTVVVTASDGGTVTGDSLDASGVLTLSEDASQAVKVQANEGYQIESVTVCGKQIEVTNSESMDVTVNFSDVETANNIVHANFVAEQVVEQEAARNEVVAEPVLDPVTVTIPETKTGNRSGLRIESTVTGETSGTLTYQWYKLEANPETPEANPETPEVNPETPDANIETPEANTEVPESTDNTDNSKTFKKLEGKIGKDLILENVTEADAGTYMVKVTNTVGTVSKESESNECVVDINLTCSHAQFVTYTPGEGGATYLASEATCNTPATYYERCSECGAKGENTFESGEVDQSKHNFGTYEPSEGDEAYLVSPATCNAKAVYYERCSECGAKGENTFESGEFNLYKHSGGTMIGGKKDPTINETGYTGDIYCNGCAEKIVEGQAIPKLTECSHKFGSYTPGDGDETFLVSAATCNARAVYHEKCTICGAQGENTFTYGEFDLNNHTFDEYEPGEGDEAFLVSAATCATPAIYHEKCTGCGAQGEKTFAYGEVDLNNHNFGEYTPTEADKNLLVNAATCTTPAVYYKKCTECGVQSADTFAYGEVDPENHVGGTRVEGAKDPTEAEDGYTGDTYCTSCNNKIEDGEVVPATGCKHEFSEYEPTEDDKVVSAATCNTPAVYHQKCTKCGAEGTDTFEYGELDPNNHVGETYLKDEKDPTETEPGYTGDKYCNGCNALLEIGKEIEAGYKVTVTGGTITKIAGIDVKAKEITTGNYKPNTLLTVEPTVPAGKHFNGWYVDNEPIKPISSSNLYQFYVKGNMNIEARFVDGAEEVTLEPTVKLVEHTRTGGLGAKQTVKLGISVDVPEGYDVISEGIIRSYNPPTEDKPLEIGQPGVTNHVSKTVFNQGNYTYSFTIAKTSANNKKPVYARGYVKCKDSTGNVIEEPFYSDGGIFKLNPDGTFEPVETVQP